MRMRSGAVPVRLAAVLMGSRRMFLSAIVTAAIVVMRSLTMMMGGSLMMCRSVMMVHARSVLLFGIVHGFSP